MTQDMPDGHRRPPAVGSALRRAPVAGGISHRRTAGPRREVLVACVAVALLVPLSLPAASGAQTREEVELAAYGSASDAVPEVLEQDGTSTDARAEVRKLLAAQETRREREKEEAERAAEEKREAERAAEEAEQVEAAEKEAERAEQADSGPSFVRPADGRFTSGFGARWGSHHSGIDIANSIGTPIVSVTGGTVVEAGPASGFGLWVKVRHDDGTVTVYGHMDRILVGAGQRVGAGEQIATIGNRGHSTGPHLHFEVWQGGQTPIDPVGWLAERGVSVR
ncbi:Murein DD-endopeptidase MepM and murein hydrolase activator NlpD, contain LysM domain [Haloechinothrix alba]|uniref:Murein DD-endopeptidase MepM and murein hydrolase activator NlpD, contain LysM domain n=1 Tax=Haloechinothrix alba TaxID=664784 RepID=A0A238X6D0_9PSEU|nr:M23 family metallopeptidase [Haloechinothrix alba]SNR54131.1 Murein DD-endopeptidase MepM and murein hydrolase activator NlpD, contain LysM domain [Haloechinothrix alba]